MKCQKCGKYDATTHIKKIINGQKSELFLCPHCANQSGELPTFKSVFDSDFENFFGGLWGSPSLGQAKTAANTSSCKTCGSTLRDIQNHGKLGCSDCYKVFGDYLLRPLKEIHGSNSHAGKLPKRAGKGLPLENEIDKLKDELSRAVLDQNFEKAAVLRDKIKEMEQKRG